MAQVHEIGYTECPKSYVFRGNKEYAAKQVQEMLGLVQPAMRPGMPMQQPGRPFPAGPASRFLLPVSQAEFQLTKAIEQLQKDPWPVAGNLRALRCTGVALSVAVGLLETSFQNAGGRIMLFSGGPATEGPGMVVGPELREPIRSHHDIDRDNIKYYKKALKVRLSSTQGTERSPCHANIRYSFTITSLSALRITATPSISLPAVSIKSVCLK